MTSGASGTGPGTVAFSAAANPNATQRSGSLTIGGQTFSVTQAAAPCTYAINPTSQSVAAGGGTGSTAVTAPTGCAWTGVSNNTSWLTVTSGASGTGPGTVAFSAAANPNATQRSGSLTIGGQTFSVTQAAAPLHVCDHPDEPVGGGRWRDGLDDGHDIGRLCVDGCQQQHVVVDGDERGQRQRHGHGRLQRGGESERRRNATARSTIAGQTFSVTQAAASCTYTINPASQSVTAAGGTGSTAVTAPTGCAWTGVSNNTSWLTVTSGASGSGGGSVASAPRPTPARHSAAARSRSAGRH